MLAIAWVLFIVCVLALVIFVGWIWNCRKPELGPLGIPVLVLAVTISFQMITFSTKDLKEERYREEETQTTVLFLKNELGINSAIANENGMAVNRDLSLLKEHRSILNPLAEFKSEMWNVAKSRGVRFITNLDDVNRIERAYAGMEIANYKIRSRENYRLTNRAMSNFEEGMMKIDTGLLVTIEEVKKAITESETILDR